MLSTNDQQASQIRGNGKRTLTMMMAVHANQLNIVPNIYPKIKDNNCSPLHLGLLAKSRSLNYVNWMKERQKQIMY